MPKRISIIGIGKVGSHLYHALRKTGRYDVNVIQRFSRRSGISKAQKDSKDVKRNAGRINNSEIIFITTQDSEIRNAARVLSSPAINFNGKYVYHTSGVMTSDELKPLERRGAETGSFHPVQTFEDIAKKNGARFNNICVVLEGSRKAISEGSKIAKNLGTIPVTIDKKDKILHHICCVIASNYIVALAHKIDEFRRVMKPVRFTSRRIRKNGFNKHSFFSIYEPLILQTLENIKTKGTVKSLTGPIERSDVAVLRKHLKELGRKIPDIVGFYKFLGRETAKVALKKGSLGKKEFRGMLRLLA